MNFLNVFEERIGSLFGATTQGLTAPFSFKKLAKKAAREMEAETFVINGVDTAPALYTILVSSEDDLVMRPLYSQLTSETAQFIEGQAQQKGYVFVGRPVVRFMADPSLRSGRFSVFAENIDVQTLNRLREEEARFLGSDTSVSGGLGGAAAVPNEAIAAAAPVASDFAAAPAASDFMAGAQPVQAVTAQPMQPIATQQPFEAPQQVQVAQDVAPVQPIQSIPAVQNVQPVQAYGTPSPVASPVFGNLDAGLDTLPQDDFYAAAAPVASAAPVAATPVAAVPSVPNVTPAVAAPQTVRVAQPTAAPAAAPITALLIDRTSGRTYTVQAPRTVLGRERNAGGIVLHDPNVSRAHAEITFDGRGWNLRDLNSTNGTLVNDTDVTTCALRDGDLITLGLTNLEFREN